MILQALLVTKDDLSAQTLIQVVAEYGVAVERCQTTEEAVARLADQRFDQVVVDFDDAEGASRVLEACRRSGNDHHPVVTVALLRDAAQTRSILGCGAHFILTRPIARAQAQNTFRAAAALLRRERRQSSWVAVQAAVSIRVLASGADNKVENKVYNQVYNQAGDKLQGIAESGVESKVESKAENNAPSKTDGGSEKHTQNKTAGSNLIEGILLELGNDGMDLLTAKPLPTASMVHICFDLPEGGSRVEADASVAWSCGNGQAGLRFHGMEGEMRGRMSAWLEARARDASPAEPDAVSECTLTDLSLGGCYVQTESPFPQCATVDLCLRAASMEVHTEGLVRVMHPGHGMGIEFPARTNDLRTKEQRKSVGDFIDFLASQPDATPQLEASPRALGSGRAEGSDSSSSGTEAEDPLVELLRTGDGLEEDAFLAALHRQRTPAAVS
jgi:DNA-binding response OmpR family regulator